MEYKPCIRCGMCCIVAPCCFSGVEDGGDCPYLVINNDDTTTCTNKYAITAFVDHGVGCPLQANNCELYNLYLEEYNISETKQRIKRKQKKTIKINR